MSTPAEAFTRLVEIVARLRAPGGCPWDREQTPHSALPYLLEEAFEAAEAIDHAEPHTVCEELGDLLLQVLFQTQLVADTTAAFTITDVVEAISEKLIRRHPHVFDETVVKDSAEVLAHWETIKREEKPERRSMLEGIPRQLPSLLRAFRLGQKASRVQFDWGTIDGVLDKVIEEVTELRQSQGTGNSSACEDELGDLLFALAQVARWMDLDPEGALRRANTRFTTRFQAMEQRLQAMQREPASLSADEWNTLWEEAKAGENA
ncbi:MAG: nucleoside triphosphate pyrophosphohydrolase [Deltaproteobacteria bacterium]|nr:nucleoside triphosphate pyrophosphohydrolase [Deltaproteobacteria bacterium]